jgi:hypothetical protein
MKNDHGVVILAVVFIGLTALMLGAWVSRKAPQLFTASPAIETPAK